jgi:hypothetical protein
MFYVDQRTTEAMGKDDKVYKRNSENERQGDNQSIQQHQKGLG